MINRLTDSAERIEPLPAMPAFVQEVSNRLFDQFVVVPIVAVSEFPLELLTFRRRFQCVLAGAPRRAR